MFLLIPGVSSAQISPNGPEFQVNTYTTLEQRRPAIAADAQGNFAVVWDSFGSNGTDTSLFSIQGRLFLANGSPRSGDFQVNSYTTGMQSDAAVAVAPEGNFVVVWHGGGSSGSDQSYQSVHAQRYDAVGTPLGSELQVNTYTTGPQFAPSVAVDALGNFVVVWQSAALVAPDTSGFSIQAQRYDSSGTPLGPEFQVNSYTTGHQRYPSVAADAQGNFVVAWQSFGSSGTDTWEWSIQAQRFDSLGNPLGTEFQVNTYTPRYQVYPAVSASSGGDFVVAWESFGSSDSDCIWCVQAQRYDSTGDPVGEEFQVNTYTNSLQRYPSVAVDVQGSFVVVWHSLALVPPDLSGFSTQAQRYDRAGNPLGVEFQVNTYTTQNQSYPSIAVDGRGNFIVAWESGGSYGSDQSLQSIQAQRYDGLFRDGFESGDAGRWSFMTP